MSVEVRDNCKLRQFLAFAVAFGSHGGDCSVNIPLDGIDTLSNKSQVSILVS